MQKIEQKLSACAVIVSTFLTGCGGLYSGQPAPVYSDTDSKRYGGYRPAAFNSTLTPILPSKIQARPQQPVRRIANETVNKVITNSQSVPVLQAARPANTGSRLNPASRDTRIKEATALLPISKQKEVVVKKIESTEIANAKNIVQKQIKKNNENVSNTAKKASDALKAPVTRPDTIVNKVSEKTNTQIATAKTAVNSNIEGATTAVKKVITKPTRTATTTLLQKAHKAVASGNLEKAASALERAHRIEPGNSKILYDIAQIRYAQGKYAQAESFASRAANSSSSNALSKKVWGLLSKSRKATGNASGAASALKKSAGF